MGGGGRGRGAHGGGGSRPRAHSPPHRSHSPPHHHSTSVHTPSAPSAPSGPRDPEADAQFVGCFFLIAGVVCLIMAIIIPIVLAQGGEDTGCSPIGTLNRKEQAYCYSDGSGDDWFASYESVGKNYARVYKANKDTPQTTRTYKWCEYETETNYTHNFFTLGSSLGLKATVTLKSDSPDRKNLKVYWLDSSIYNGEGTFYEDKYTPVKFDFSEETVVLPQLTAEANTYTYLVFSCALSEVYALYDVEVEYKVYDTSSLKSVSCSNNTCGVDELDDDELIIIEHVSASENATPESGVNAPEFFEIDIFQRSTDWGKVLLALFLLLIGGLALIALGLFVLYKYSKKAAKIMKKLLKKIYKKSKKAKDEAEDKADDAKDYAEDKADKVEDHIQDNMPSNSTPMDTYAQPAAAAQPAPQAYAAAPAYGADGQAYAGQQYPGQAYPGAPAYGADGQAYAGQQQYPGQAYPGQAYPGQPYPGQ